MRWLTRFAVFTLVVVSIARALEPSPRVITVHTADALVHAIGPDRVVRLQPGVYDLSTVVRREHPHVAWPSRDARQLTIHDLQGLTIEGSSAGEVFLTADSRLALRFQKAGGLALRHLTIGPPPGEIVSRYRTRTGFIDEMTFQDIEGLSIEDVHTSRAIFGGMRFDGASGVTLRNVDLGMRNPLEISNAADVRLEDSWLRPQAAAISISGDQPHLELRGVSIVTALRPDAELGELIVTAPSTTATIEDVRSIDEASGKVRRSVDRGALPLPIAARERWNELYTLVRRNALLTPDEVAVSDAVVRLADSRDPVSDVVVRLADGREPVSDFRSATGAEFNPETLQVRRLGSPSGPILLDWTDAPQGNGGFADGYYRVLANGRKGPLLLAGWYSVSGSMGAGNGGGETRVFAFENGLLTMRGEQAGIKTHQEAGNPWEQADAEGRLFVTEWRRVFEVVYRLSGSRLTPVRYEEFEQIQPGDDVAAKLAAGAKPSWPHADKSLPVAGEWLKTVLSPKEGAEKYPAIDLKWGEPGA
jgi:hypothetical protein